MRLLKLCALALVAETVHGYLDTAPFFMLSTSELLTPTSKLQSASSIVLDVSLSLSDCPSDFYVLVSQPGVHAKDYASRKSSPTLAQRLSSKPGSIIRSSVAINDVLGDIDTSSWVELLQTKCGVQLTEIDAATGAIPTTYGTLPRLLTVYLPAPSTEQRAKDLSQNDAFFASILDMLPSRNFTVLYTTSPGRSSRRISVPTEEKEYEMESEIQEAMHIDLKRDLSTYTLGKRDNQTIVDGPLFEKYQFFTPGIFMGFLVGSLFLIILYVAISAVASLQVTYAAFDKEVGQLAAKKQK